MPLAAECRRRGSYPSRGLGRSGPRIGREVDDAHRCVELTLVAVFVGDLGLDRGLVRAAEETLDQRSVALGDEAVPIPTKPPVCNGMIAPRDPWMMPPPCNEMIPPGAPRLLA